MPTADEIETNQEALRDAALAVAADGSTGTVAQMGDVTATSTRKYINVVYEGPGAVGRMKRDFERNHPAMMPGQPNRADGVVLVCETEEEVITIARVRK
jgi:hypothetical protein